MQEFTLTDAAQRVLAALESPEDSHWPPTRRLVLALLRDEGRGTEILRNAGILPAQIHSLPASSDDTIDDAQWRAQLLREADRFAIRLSPMQQTGSEHLLLAVLQLDPELREHIAQSGLTVANIEERIRETPVDLTEAVEAIVHVSSAGTGTIDRASLFRILDASANRCREGLRVVEDAARFQLNDALLSRELKDIRHLLASTLTHLGQHEWLSCRDAQQDVGRSSGLASERHRGSILDVLRAAMKRVEESLRSLEEYSKLIDQEMSGRIAGCRYRFYTVEQALETSLRSRHRLENCRLYLLVTDEHCRYGAERTIRDVITAGVDVVQLREKEIPARQYISYATQLRKWTHDAGVLLIINDRADIAVAVGADGVHLGQDDLDVASARKILGGDGLIGVSTHALEQARAAVFAGADYLGVGPVFPSGTKAFQEFPGLDYVAEVSQAVSLPWFAIGGIGEQNVSQVLAAGAQRIAVSAAICQAPHPPRAATQLSEWMKTGHSPEQTSGKSS